MRISLGKNYPIKENKKIDLLENVPSILRRDKIFGQYLDDVTDNI